MDICLTPQTFAEAGGTRNYLGDKYAQALKVGGVLLGVARILHA